MIESEYKIVRITNIAPFDFTGDLGARFGGRDFFIPAGGSLLVPLTIGDHLARNIARQIIIQKAPIRDDKELDGKGSTRPLWDDASIEELKAKIMVEAFEEEKQTPKSEADIMAARIADLNESTKEDTPNIDGGNVDASSIVPTESINSDVVYQDKAEVIAELHKREITFDARGSKATLEELLKG